jgi:hypothetical protein
MLRVRVMVRVRFRVITLAKLEYDLEQLPPFAFLRASTIHSFIRPCFSR